MNINILNMSLLFREVNVNTSRNCDMFVQRNSIQYYKQANFPQISSIMTILILLKRNIIDLMSENWQADFKI